MRMTARWRVIPTIWTASTSIATLPFCALEVCTPSNIVTADRGVAAGIGDAHAEFFSAFPSRDKWARFRHRVASRMTGEAERRSVTGSGLSRIEPQPGKFLLDHGVALARKLLKPGPVHYGEVAATVIKHAQLLQLVGSIRDAFTANSEHVGHQFVSHSQLIAWQTVKSRQNPTAQVLFYRVMSVADCGLGHLRHQGLHVAQYQPQQFIVAIELVLECAVSAAHRRTRRSVQPLPLARFRRP